MENKKFDMKSWIELKNMKDDKIQNIFNGIKRELEDCIDKMRGIQIDKDIPTPECRIVDYEVNRSSIFYNTLRKIENHYDTKILNFKTTYKDGYIFGYINIDGIDYQFKIMDSTKER